MISRACENRQNHGDFANLLIRCGNIGSDRKVPAVVLILQPVPLDGDEGQGCLLSLDLVGGSKHDNACRSGGLGRRVGEAGRGSGVAVLSGRGSAPRPELPSGTSGAAGAQEWLAVGRSGW